jgi:hypothetical protein
MHVHHVHLNSVDPAKAAAYYPKPFAQTATKTTFNGYEAVKTGNVYLLFTKVSTPPPNELTGQQTAVWHFGWNTPDSRKYDEQFRKMGLQIAQMWDAADGKLVDMSSDTLPGLPTQEQILEMRAKGVQPTREGGFGYLRGPDGIMIEDMGFVDNLMLHGSVVNRGGSVVVGDAGQDNLYTDMAAFRAVLAIAAAKLG